MTGIEKVTGRIIADAEADARKILEDADAECAAVRARYEAQADAERERLADLADRECEAIITRAKSSAAMAKRDVLLEKRAALVAEAYAAAEKEIKNLSSEEYLDLLLSMLKGTLKGQLANEQENLDVYGEDITPEKYEVLLNHRDREQYGQALMEALQRAMVGKIRLSVLEKVGLSNESANIDGGLVLRCGDVEINCSLSTIFAEARRKTEIKVSHVLFGRESAERSPSADASADV